MYAFSGTYILFLVLNIYKIFLKHIVHLYQLHKAKGPGGFRSLYNGFGVSVAGIIPYRGVYFGMYDSLSTVNPLRHKSGPIGLASKFAIAQVLAQRDSIRLITIL